MGTNIATAITGSGTNQSQFKKLLFDGLYGSTALLKPPCITRKIGDHFTGMSCHFSILLHMSFIQTIWKAHWNACGRAMWENNSPIQRSSHNVCLECNCTHAYDRHMCQISIWSSDWQAQLSYTWAELVPAQILWKVCCTRMAQKQALWSCSYRTLPHQFQWRFLTICMGL